MVTWPYGHLAPSLSACGKIEHHGGEHMMEQSCLVHGGQGREKERERKREREREKSFFDHFVNFHLTVSCIFLFYYLSLWFGPFSFLNLDIHLFTKLGKFLALTS
jgi:hypothetical protein